MLNFKKVFQIGLLSSALIGSLSISISAQAEDQFISIPSYRVGPYGANGQAFYGGFVDYLNYVNMKENGVKLNITTPKVLNAMSA